MEEGEDNKYDCQQWNFWFITKVQTKSFIVPCVNASCSRTTGHHTIGIEESVDLLINFDSTSVGLRT